MTVEEKLKQKIKRNFKSVNAFATELGVPYTTLNTMLNKGVQYSSLALVMQVCNGLGISLSELANGLVQNTPDASFRLISERERRHITRYRALDQYGKKAVDTLLDVEYARMTETSGYIETLPIAARSKSGVKKSLEIRRDFDPAELQEEDSEF